MLCPRCRGDSEVNRTVDLNDSIERNRRCMKCGKYFNTVEILKHEYEQLAATQPDGQKLLHWS